MLHLDYSKSYGDDQVILVACADPADYRVYIDFASHVAFLQRPQCDYYCDESKEEMEEWTWRLVRALSDEEMNTVVEEYKKYVGDKKDMSCQMCETVAAGWHCR